MIRRPPRSTQGVSSAASDVYKRQSDVRRGSAARTGRQRARPVGGLRERRRREIDHSANHRQLPVWPSKSEVRKFVGVAISRPIKIRSIFCGARSRLTNTCSRVSNQRWCCGGEQNARHFDLSYAAFDSIAIRHRGIVDVKYRKVSCDGLGQEKYYA